MFWPHNPEPLGSSLIPALLAFIGTINWLDVNSILGT
jgi:hypothetical protein